MGDRIFEPYWAVNRHSSGACELLFVLAGRVCTVMPGRRRFSTGPGGIVLIPPGTRHRDEFDPQTGLSVFMITFRWRDASAYFSLLPCLDGLAAGDASVRHDVKILMARMRALLHSGTESDRLLARACLLDLLLTVLHAQLRRRTAGSRRDNGAGQRRRRLMLMARRYLDEHYAEEISLEIIAGKLGISPFYLSHLFSQESDFSLSAYLAELRMRQAERLLLTGRYSIKEAACAVGFRDGNYFAKVFRRHFGMTPGAVRNRVKT